MTAVEIVAGVLLQSMKVLVLFLTIVALWFLVYDGLWRKR